MKFRHIHYFHAVAQEQHFGRAAEILHVDPSAVSKSLKSLEDYLGVRLFNRARGTGISLTKEGLVFQNKTQNIITDLEQIKELLNPHLSSKNKTIRLVTSYYTNIHRLSELLRLFQQQAPHIQIQIEQKTHSELIKGTLIGNFDVGISYSPDISYTETKDKIGEDKIIALLPKRHPLVQQEKISIHNAVSFNLICLYQQFAVQQEISHLFKNLEINIHKIKHVESYSLLLALVSAGHGIGIIPEGIYEHMKNSNVVARHFDENYVINTYIFSISRSILTKEFISVAKPLYY